MVEEDKEKQGWLIEYINFIDKVKKIQLMIL